MLSGDLDAVDRVLCVAFATVRGLDDPATAFGDADLARTRFRAAPDAAWVAELDGEVVGSVFAARWGTFGFFGPLSVDPALWDRRIARRLLEPVLEAFEQWELQQAGLFTFAGSPRHLGLYGKHGFSPGAPTVIAAKPTDPGARGAYELASGESDVDGIRGLTDQVFPGLDLTREILAAQAQGIGETILVRGDGTLDGVAVCHRGAGSEAGSDTCFVKFGAVPVGPTAAADFDALLDACDAFAAARGVRTLLAGTSLAREGAYKRMQARGFRTVIQGVSMHRPNDPGWSRPEVWAMDDLR